MKNYLRYKVFILAGSLIISCLSVSYASAESQEYANTYCADYSIERLTQEGNSDEMDLSDQYRLVSQYYADCMDQKKTEIRNEAAYVNQPVFFN